MHIVTSSSILRDWSLHGAGSFTKHADNPRIAATMRDAFPSPYTLNNSPGRFHATADCNRCRTCEGICPTRNISVRTDTVSWGHPCTQCYASIHWCPIGAIEIGGRTAGNPRYHHPNVTHKDMLDQRAVRYGEY